MPRKPKFIDLRTGKPFATKAAALKAGISPSDIAEVHATRHGYPTNVRFLPGPRVVKPDDTTDK